MEICYKNQKSNFFINLVYSKRFFRIFCRVIFIINSYIINSFHKNYNILYRINNKNNMGKNSEKSFRVF